MIVLIQEAHEDPEIPGLFCVDTDKLPENAYKEAVLDGGGEVPYGQSFSGEEMNVKTLGSIRLQMPQQVEAVVTVWLE